MQKSSGSRNMAEISPAKIKVSLIHQIALVVRDAQKVAHNYWNILGIGPWDVYEYHSPRLHNLTYRGKPAQFNLKVFYTTVGTTELELIEPVSGENIYSDFLADHGEGLHHLLFVVDDVDKTTKIMSNYGISVLQSGHINDGYWAYYDTAEALKTIWEVARLPTKMSPEYRYP